MGKLPVVLDVNSSLLLEGFKTAETPASVLLLMASTIWAKLLPVVSNEALPILKVLPAVTVVAKLAPAVLTSAPVSIIETG